MSTYRITGKRAAIDGIHCISRFSLQHNGLDTVAACSATNGAVLRGTGNLDWLVTVTGYGLPPKYPGETFTFTGSDRNGQGWQSGASGGIMDTVKVICPIGTGRHILWQGLIRATGSLAKGAYQATDSATPNPLSAKGLSFLRDGETVYGVDGWSLEIKGNLTAPKWPSHMGGWPVRDHGNIDAVLEWSQTFDAMSQLPDVNSFYEMRPYVDGTRYFDLKWMQVLEEPVKYEIEGNPPGRAEYVEMADCKAYFSGYKDGAAGYLKKPGGTAYWPEA